MKLGKVQVYSLTKLFGVAALLITFSSPASSQVALPGKDRQDVKPPALAIKLSTATPIVCVGDKMVWQYELTNLTSASIEFDENMLYGNYLLTRFIPTGANLYGLREAKQDPNWHSIVANDLDVVAMEPHTTQIRTLVWPAGSALVAKTGKYFLTMTFGGGSSNEAIYEVFDCGQPKESEQQP